MFQIFGKKEFLVDHLANFVDIHNHILPGIDDGAKTPEESLGLIEGFGEFGVTRFIATPHIMHNYYPNTRESIAKAFALLRNELLKNDLKHISIATSAEHMIDDNYESLLNAGDIMPMATDYILVEMSYLQRPINFREAIIKTVSKRLYPILAHPERYNFLHKNTKKYAVYKERGILFQLNLLSLGDFYGKEVQKIALKLLDDGLVDYVGSDVHNLNQLNALKDLTLPKKTIRQLVPVIHQTIETFY